MCSPQIQTATIGMHWLSIHKYLMPNALHKYINQYAQVIAFAVGGAEFS